MATESDGSGAATPRRRWWQRLLRGPAFVVVALVGALAGVAAPMLWNAARDVSRPPVLVWASSDGGPVDDRSYALPDVADPAEIGTPAEFLADSPALRRAVKAGVHGTTVTIEGARSRDVVITNMRARILSREPNVAGTLLCSTPQGDLPAKRIGFDLDEFRPVARVLDGRRLGEPYFTGQAQQLADGETVVFQVESRADDGHYRWVIDVDLVIDGQPQTYTAKPDTGEFEMTGFSPRYGAVFAARGMQSWSFPDRAGGC
ncbi:hypothetical protein SAMN05216215_1001335 [Saccharopolyspora shandongensis]|uniref:Uncharacterized protein n=1 Tax=Saccharopolyspora shandongensis TaxID=418495 RepID=A0A1H2RA67_9PSEU|nr:hypothetical protein [Saccharopolyspora shandongensis]SDW16322.1 hypothetical protein SAMN05216215_1001335 [Saccharopolyspora shandongensis]